MMRSQEGRVGVRWPARPGRAREVSGPKKVRGGEGDGNQASILRIESEPDEEGESDGEREEGEQGDQGEEEGEEDEEGEEGEEDEGGESTAANEREQGEEGVEDGESTGAEGGKDAERQADERLFRSIMSLPSKSALSEAIMKRRFGTASIIIAALKRLGLRCSAGGQVGKSSAAKMRARILAAYERMSWLVNWLGTHSERGTSHIPCLATELLRQDPIDLLSKCQRLEEIREQEKECGVEEEGHGGVQGASDGEERVPRHQGPLDGSGPLSSQWTLTSTDEEVRLILRSLPSSCNLSLPAILALCPNLLATQLSTSGPPFCSPQPLPTSTTLTLVTQVGMALVGRSVIYLGKEFDDGGLPNNEPEREWIGQLVEHTGEWGMRAYFPEDRKHDDRGLLETLGHVTSWMDTSLKHIHKAARVNRLAVEEEVKARGGLLKGKGAGRNSLGAKLFALLHGVEAQEASIVIPTSPLSSPPSLIAPTPSVPTLHVLCLASRAFHHQHTSLPSVQRLSVRPNFHNTHAFRSNTACALTFHPLRSHHHTSLPSVPTLSVSVTSHHTHAFRPDAACADLPSYAFRHHHTSLPSVPTLSVSVTSHHTHAFRPDAACADLPSFAFRHHHTSLPSVPTLSVSVTSHHTHAFRPDAACADLPSFAFRHHHTSLPSVPILSVSVTSHHTHAFRPDAACADLPSFAFRHHHTALPSVPTLSVSVTSHHTHAFRPDAACADLPSFAFRHDHTALPSVPTLSVSVTSHHTHAFRPDAGCVNLPSLCCSDITTHHCLPSQHCR